LLLSLTTVQQHRNRNIYHQKADGWERFHPSA